MTTCHHNSFIKHATIATASGFYSFPPSPHVYTGVSGHYYHRVSKSQICIAASAASNLPRCRVVAKPPSTLPNAARKLILFCPSTLPSAGHPIGSKHLGHTGTLNTAAVPSSQNPCQPYDSMRPVCSIKAVTASLASKLSEDCHSEDNRPLSSVKSKGKAAISVHVLDVTPSRDAFPPNAYYRRKYILAGLESHPTQGALCVNRWILLHSESDNNCRSISFFSIAITAA